MATKEKSGIKIGKHVVSITNRQKIYWPGEGFTKGDLIDYYDKMADYILPYLKGRCLSLKRNPNGINDKGFIIKMQGKMHLLM
jgi:bifunctional non-homologous end joining protein LigD